MIFDKVRTKDCQRPQYYWFQPQQQLQQIPTSESSKPIYTHSNEEMEGHGQSIGLICIREGAQD